MNEYDSNRILDFVKKINFFRTDKINQADCYVLNTCHIREKATDKVYHDIGRLKKEFRDKKKPIVLVTGCVAQAEGDLILKREKYIDAVIGPQSYHKINETILEIDKNKNKIELTEFETIKKFDHLASVISHNNKVSSYLTIQEGCDKFCKFCVVPYTRGPEYSRNFSEIINEAKEIINNGAKEITLLGQNVNAYNFENKKKLPDLIYALNEIKELKRIRYTTSHPKDFTKELVEVHKNCNKLMPLLHLPIQSGSSKILKEMNRKHNIEEYLEIIKMLKNDKPSIRFSSDFIIGYPEETEKDFTQTLLILKKIKFINSYSFIFSPRPGTPAAKMKLLDPIIAKKRLLKFQLEANSIKKNYREKLIGSIVNVLFENRLRNEEAFFGRDEYNNSVIVKSNKDLIGKTIKVKINEYNQNTLFGEFFLDYDTKNFAA